jgi:hypothetical protein
MKWWMMIIVAVSLIGKVSANTTGYYPGYGMDYYWVPGNFLLFHINYPWDFILYALAIIGFLFLIGQGIKFLLRNLP